MQTKTHLLTFMMFQTHILLLKIVRYFKKSTCCSFPYNESKWGLELSSFKMPKNHNKSNPFNLFAILQVIWRYIIAFGSYSSENISQIKYGDANNGHKTWENVFFVVHSFQWITNQMYLCFWHKSLWNIRIYNIAQDSRRLLLSYFYGGFLWVWSLTAHHLHS